MQSWPRMMGHVPTTVEDEPVQPARHAPGMPSRILWITTVMLQEIGIDHPELPQNPGKNQPDQRRQR